MTESEKVIVLARHGKHKDNILVPEAIKQAYEVGGSLKKKYFPEGISEAKSFISHSGQQRTIDTGKSLIAGILGLGLPNSQKDFEKSYLLFEKIWTTRNFLLGYDDLEYNEEALYEKYEEDEYMKIWAANPDSTDFEGQHVTCYNEMLRRGRACLGETIDEMIYNSQTLAILSTHLTIVEPIFMAAVNSARKTPCTLDDIGGVFETGECAELVLRSNREYRYTEGEFIRKDKKYDVSLTNLLSVCEE